MCNVAYHFKDNCIVNVFIHFSEEMVSKLYQSIYWIDTIFKLKTILIKCKYTEKLVITMRNIRLITSHYLIIEYSV
jgi:hypothetical protein